MSNARGYRGYIGSRPYFGERAPQHVQNLVIRDYCQRLCGQALLFAQTLMHGNRINQENESRWSMNCRFKSVFSPYADKKLGEFFEPITLRPATRLAMSYDLPNGFNE